MAGDDHQAMAQLVEIVMNGRVSGKQDGVERNSKNSQYNDSFTQHRYIQGESKFYMLFCMDRYVVFSHDLNWVSLNISKKSVF